MIDMDKTVCFKRIIDTNHIKMNKNNNLSQIIRKLRMDKSMTVNQLAELAELSSPYVSQLEHDKAYPSIFTLQRIATALDVHIFEFFVDEIIKESIVLPKEEWTKIIILHWKADVNQLVHMVGNNPCQRL